MLDNDPEPKEKSGSPSKTNRNLLGLFQLFQRNSSKPVHNFVSRLGWKQKDWIA